MLNNHELREINKDAFVNVENLEILTLRQNRKLTWDSSQGSLFSLFRNLSHLEMLILEANNITGKGKNKERERKSTTGIQKKYRMNEILNIFCVMKQKVEFISKF